MATPSTGQQESNNAKDPLVLVPHGY